MTITLFPVGIKTAHGKYLTVESFGDQLNANGPSLRSKQVFILETDGNGHHSFKTHKGKYLSADHKEATAAAAHAGAHELFVLGFNNGLVSIKTSEGKYLSADASGKIGVNSASVGANEEFEIEINMHPQVCLLTQKRYIGVTKEGQVVSNLNSQFGRETLLTIEPSGQRGQFAIKGANDKYLSVEASGKVVADHTEKDDASTHFAFEPVLDNFAIKNIGTGAYLSALGTGLKAGRNAISPKEIFSIFDSDGQVTLKAAINEKYLSYQGANLISNKTGVTKEEIFILEFSGLKAAFKTQEEKYWSVSGGGITVSASSKGPHELFDIEYHDNKVAFKTHEGTYVSAKKLGGIDAKSKAVEEAELFEMRLFNRPVIVLKAAQESYVGTHSKGDSIVSNKVLPELFTAEFKDGRYAFKNHAGKYFSEGPENKIVTSPTPEWFLIEIQGTRLAIKAKDGKYITSENQGWLVAKANSVGPNELFEF